MSIWKKKPISKEVVQELSTKYSCDPIIASILSRRGITESNDILFYTETDQRFLHNPFLFENMEDAVDRINDALEENEKVLIFGDRDVDGITSTTVLYNCLKNLGMDVSYKVPNNDETYGLTFEVIDEFAKNLGTLLITVDCGISNKAEIEYAATKGISVIVTDHHNPPEDIPEDAIIINPKIYDCKYPFKDISGCAVAYKLVQAIEFSKCELYKQNICLMNVRPLNDSYIVECIKVENMVEKARIAETIVPGVIDIYSTRLIPFLKDQQIFVWDFNLQKKMLHEIFGKNIELNMMDIRPEVAKIIPSAENLSLLRLKEHSKIAKYDEKLNTEIDTFFNIFVTYIQKTVFKTNSENNDFNLQLVALAAIADIMPLRNENRILVRLGLNAMNSGKIRPGLQELIARLGLTGKKITSTDLGWTIVPCLNATGRLGEPDTALKLLTTEDPRERDKIAERILNLNQQRKTLGTEAWNFVQDAGFKSLETYCNNLCVVYDNRVNRGVTGIVASKLIAAHKVPSIIITEVDDCAIGSARSTRGYKITELMDQCSDIFIKHGGHDFAAGFSLEKQRVPEFLARLQKLSCIIEFQEESSEDVYEIAAELPEKYITKDIMNKIEKLEPFGNENPEPMFLTRNLKIKNVEPVGKGNTQHLKLTFDINGAKWPALYWNSMEKYKREFEIGDNVDFIFQMSRNQFNGMETLQLTIKDLARSGTHEIL